MNTFERLKIKMKCGECVYYRHNPSCSTGNRYECFIRLPKWIDDRGYNRIVFKDTLGCDLGILKSPEDLSEVYEKIRKSLEF